VGLSRQEESFQRPYSAPEPPKVARRPKLLALLIALVSFVAAAVAVFALAPGDGDRQVAGPPGPSATGAGPGTPADEPTPSHGPPSTSASPSEPAGPRPAKPFTAVPKPCGSVRKGTVDRLLPGARQEESGDSTYRACTYSSTSDGFRWLRVEGRLFSAAGSGTSEQAARDDLAAHWKGAHEAKLERTVRLERRSGIGDEAFAWFKVDRGQPTAVGQLTMRVRNVVITVSYSEQVTGETKAGDRERVCLGNATGVVREVLAVLA
jgi:hypothetical protein